MHIYMYMDMYTCLQPRLHQRQRCSLLGRVQRTTSKDNHLSLKKGALVTVYEQKDKWWSGELDGNVGWFPKTFVKIISEGEATGGGEKSTSKSQETM